MVWFGVVEWVRCGRECVGEKGYEWRVIFGCFGRVGDEMK